MDDGAPACDHDRESERMARNEARFRDINEAIERGRETDDAVHRIGFVCECARPDCARIIDLTPAEYEAVRGNPKRFFVVDGHQIPDVERTVERHDRYLVVEKLDPGARIAEELDPRA